MRKKKGKYLRHLIPERQTRRNRIQNVPRAFLFLPFGDFFSKLLRSSKRNMVGILFSQPQAYRDMYVYTRIPASQTACSMYTKGRTRKSPQNCHEIFLPIIFFLILEASIEGREKFRIRASTYCCSYRDISACLLIKHTCEGMESLKPFKAV